MIAPQDGHIPDSSSKYEPHSVQNFAIIQISSHNNKPAARNDLCRRFVICLYDFLHQERLVRYVDAALTVDLRNLDVDLVADFHDVLDFLDAAL